MERRNLGAGLMVLASSLLLMAGTASAFRPASTPAALTPNCVVHALNPTAINQGEFGTASSVATVIQVGCNSEFAGQTVKITDQELYSRCRTHLSWSVPYPYKPVLGQTISKVKLDDLGNATVVAWGGPGCATGETIVAAHLEEAPYTTVTTPFTIEKDAVTEEGVFAVPSSLIEDDVTSSVATVVNVEFPSVYAERYVDINAEQLYARCLIKPHLMWVGPDEKVLLSSGESLSKVQLDNSGNAFVVLLGGGSCASGPSEIEASLEKAPYTTKSTIFTVESPKSIF